MYFTPFMPGSFEGFFDFPGPGCGGLGAGAGDGDRSGSVGEPDGLKEVISLAKSDCEGAVEDIAGGDRIDSADMERGDVGRGLVMDDDGA